MTRWPWWFVVHQVSRGQHLYEIWAKSRNSRPNYWWFRDFLHTLCLAITLTFVFLTLNFYGTSSVMRLKSVQNLSQMNNPRLSYWRFSTFTPCNFRGWGISAQRFSGVRGPNFTKLGGNIGRSFRFNLHIRCIISEWQRVEGNWGRNYWPKFALFAPVKISDRWAKCPCKGCKFSRGSNLLYTFGEGLLRVLEDWTHFFDTNFMCGDKVASVSQRWRTELYHILRKHIYFVVVSTVCLRCTLLRFGTEILEVQK